VELRTKRLILREFREDDWQAVLSYQSNPLYLRYYEWTERKPDEVQAFVRVFLDQQIEIPRIKYQFAIELKQSGALIGNCGIRKEFAEAVEAEIGFELDPEFWGCGYATEATAEMVKLGFKTFGVTRISASCIAENIGSARVLEKLGMKEKERIRENKTFKGRTWDTLVYTVSAYHWATTTEKAT